MTNEEAITSLEEFINSTKGDIVDTSLLTDVLEYLKDPWQPIETAPDDNTPILITGGTYCYDQWMYVDNEPFGNDVVIASKADNYSSTPYRRDGYGSEYNGEYWHNPTKWMPLPNTEKDN